jgi:hypothetical protein
MVAREESVEMEPMEDLVAVVVPRQVDIAHPAAAVMQAVVELLGPIPATEEVEVAPITEAPINQIQRVEILEMVQ